MSHAFVRSQRVLTCVPHSFLFGSFAVAPRFGSLSLPWLNCTIRLWNLTQIYHSLLQSARFKSDNSLNLSRKVVLSHFSLKAVKSYYIVSKWS